MAARPCRVFALWLATFAASVAAQSSPDPAFSTIPTHPFVNESFEGVLSTYAYAAALGVMDTTVDIPNQRIAIRFDLDCGFICPGTPSYQDFHFPMPALPAGDYQVHFDFGYGATGDFPLQVGGSTAPLSVPAIDTPSLVLIALLLLALCGADLRSRRIKREGHRPTCT